MKLRMPHAATGHLGLSHLAILAISLLVGGRTTLGDVAAPVSIRLPADRPQALAGQEYSSEFLVTVSKPGMLTDFSIVGEGWTVVLFQPPATPLRVEPGVIRVPFRALPTDADKAIGLRLRHNGRPAQHSYRVGPAAFAKKGNYGRLTTATGMTPGALKPQGGGPRPEPVDRGDGSGGPGTRGGTVVVEGRIVYDRAGRDSSDPSDGDFNDPGDIPPMQIGADGISVEILDNDPVDYEVMWQGVTDEHGRFVTPPLDADVDGDGSGPDLILRAVAVRNECGGVFDEDADWYYVWDSEEIEDFEGNHYNFGTRFPLDPAQHPAIHVYNSLIRAWRFIVERHGFQTRPVRIHWPVDHWSEYHADDEEIHILVDHTWEESTVIHEFGHHFIHGIYEPSPPDYDNGFCDEGSPLGDCFPSGGTWPPGTGHCLWCQENASDAWNEGWPDWLGDVVPRSFLTRYIYDVGGAPYQALYPYDFEGVGTCCVDGMSHTATITEGFVAALLHDIDDASQDDHDSDGIMDLTCLGPEEILSVLINQRPTTVTQFISAFISQYPQHRSELWSTANNVGGSVYLSGFPADSQPPGVATAGDSPSHPSGFGGALPCITVEFNPAPDDATGASVYSVIATTNPAGQDPGTTPSPTISGADTCRLRAVVGVGDLGTYYVSLRARDGDLNWSPQWATFGPFIVYDCNGSGFIDLCDIRCCSPSCEAGPPVACRVGEGYCPEGSCGTSSDCNDNFVPDECDIAQGHSEDCNQNGIPDECETSTLKHWTGNDGTNPTWWHLGTNWAEGAAPTTGNDVCIAAGEPTPLLRRDAFTLGTLACYQNLSVMQAAGQPAARLILNEPSFIEGNLSMTSGRIDVNESLVISGTLSWSGGTLAGPGETTVTGAHQVTGGPALSFHTLNLQCDTLVTAGGFSGGGNTNFVIRNFPGFTYTQAEGIVHQGNSCVFVNEGTFLKPSGTGVLRLDSPVNNSGEIRANQGTLRFGTGLVSTGSIVGLPGTTLEFSGSQDFAIASSLVGDTIVFQSSATPDSRHVRGAYDAGAGTSIISGASVTWHNTADVVDFGNLLLIDGGTGHFEAVFGGPMVLQDVIVRGGASFDGGDPVLINGTLEFGPGNGVMRGASQQWTINGLFTWKNSSDIFDPGTIDANGGIMIEASSGSRTLSRVLNNPGTATFLGPIEPNTTGHFINLPTGLAILQGDSTGLTSGSSTNAGTMVRTVGAGRATLSGMTNSGLIHVQTGELYMPNGGTNSSEIRGDAGTLLTLAGSHEMTPVSILNVDDLTFFGQGTSNIRGNVNIAGTLLEDGGNCTFTNQAIVTSYGQELRIQGGTVRLEAAMAGPSLVIPTISVSGNVHFTAGQPVTTSNLALVTGTINGTPPITVNGPFTFNSGTILTGGLMTANGSVSINSTGGTRNLQRSFDNAATMTFVNGGLQLANATLTNLATGTIDIPTTGAAFGLTTTATLQNNGILVKSAGAGTSTIGNHFRNAGTVDVRTGVLSFTGTNGLTHIQTAGQTILNGGNLAVTSPGVYQVQGGELKGNGTITGNVTNSGGVLKPGMSAGLVAITGAYTQLAGGSFAIEIGGTAAGQFDVLTVSGAATLAGELNVQTINGFTPATGNTFVILTAGSLSGTFATLSGTPGFSVSYTPTQVILTFTAPSLPGDLNGDCTVDIADLAALLSNYGTTSGATPEMGDVDGDGDVELADLATLLGNFGSSC